MARKLKVFLSSTAQDLAAFRKAVHARLAASPLFECIRQEDFGAKPHPAVDLCRAQVQEADLFIGLIGMRRGWEPPDDPGKRSITEMEYHWAKSTAPRFMYVTRDDFPVPGNLREIDDLHARHLAFRVRVTNELVVSQEGFVSLENLPTPEVFAQRVVDDLTKHVLGGDLIERVRQRPAPEDPRPGRAVFFDRDGTLNKAYIRNGKPYSPDTVEEMVIVPDAREALDRLRQRGFQLILATNQPDIARGRLTQWHVDAMNSYLKNRLPLDSIEVCPHDDADNCDCRKPKPGLLLRAAQRDGISLSQSFMVGDRFRDIEAGHAAGCKTILLGEGYGETFRNDPDVAVSSLTEAADWILREVGDAASRNDLAAENLTQRPAAFRFGLRGSRIDVLPETPEVSNPAAADLYDELRAKTEDLADRLARSNASQRVQDSVNRLIKTLGRNLKDVRPGLLLSRSRSIEADRNAFNTPKARRELFPDAIARMDDVLLTLRDLLAVYPVVRQIETEQLALTLERDPRTVKSIRKNTAAITAAAEDSEAATPAAVAALKEHDADINAARTANVRAHLIADQLLVVRNFASEALRAAFRRAGSELKELGADSWDQIKENLPEGVGKAVRVLPLGALAVLLVSIAGPIGGLAAFSGSFKELAKVIGKFAGRKGMQRKGNHGNDRHRRRINLSADGCRSLPHPTTATQSISTSNGLGHDGTCTKIRAGFSPAKWRSYTGLDLAKCDGSGVQ